MLRVLTAFLVLLVMSPIVTSAQEAADDGRPRFAIALHGGAGTIRRENMTPEREQAYRRTMEDALRAGHRILADGGTSLDAVEATILLLEDSPLFNAGKGAVMTAEGRCELDASLMRGEDGQAGAVAGVTNVKNPIKAARAVMEQSPHVLLVAGGAEQFAEEVGLELVPNEYFHTDERKAALERAQQREREQGSRVIGIGEGRDDSAAPPVPVDTKFGTVGCVALDQHGNLAAGTSTGGLTNKRFGRVGDSPLIGAGTWADNDSAAVSCTGQGEYFIRLQVAHDLAARMTYAGQSLREAADVQMQRIGKHDALGGLVAMNREGEVAFTFNTEGMYRGSLDAQGNVHVAIYGDADDRIPGDAAGLREVHAKPLE